MNYDDPSEERPQPDWQAEIVQDRILRPAPNVVVRFLLIHDSHVTGSGWQFYATALRCVGGSFVEVFHGHGPSLRIDRVDHVSQMTTPGKAARKHWPHIWSSSASRYGVPELTQRADALAFWIAADL